MFQVDLFSARGVLPRDIQDVLARHKDFMYSSRTQYNTDVFRRIHTWKTRLCLALARIPDEKLSDAERQLKKELSELPDITILHRPGTFRQGLQLHPAVLLTTGSFAALTKIHAS